MIGDGIEIWGAVVTVRPGDTCPVSKAMPTDKPVLGMAFGTRPEDSPPMDGDCVGAVLLIAGDLYFLSGGGGRCSAFALGLDTHSNHVIPNTMRGAPQLPPRARPSLALFPLRGCLDPLPYVF